jgi:uncharacterized protein (DUF58 family)
MGALAQHRPSREATDLAQVLKEAAGVVRRRSLVFVVSDFISAPGWEKSLMLLSARHDVVAVRLTDPLERHIPDLGFLTFQDAETGEQFFVDTHNRDFQERFGALTDARDRALRGIFDKAGVDVLELATEDDVMDALLHFADLRKQSQRRSA